MVTIYKVTHEAGCPRLLVPDSLQQLLERKDTEHRFKDRPPEPVRCKLANRAPVDHHQFYFVHDSVLAIPLQLTAKYEDVFWVLESNAADIWLKVGNASFEVIDILATLPPDKARGAPCLVDKHYSPIFRIESDPQGIYASSGHLEPVDELYGTYHHWKLKGLVFTPVWSGEV